MSRAFDYGSSLFDDDLEIDIAFGRWLKERRIRCSLTLGAAARFSGIHEDRIDELERGGAERGITKLEAESIAPVYGLDLKAILQRAVTG